MSTPKRILVIRLSAMGDVAIAVPAIDAMRRQHPDTELYVLSNKAYAPFFKPLDGVRFIGIKTSDYEGLSGLWRLFKELKAYKFDMIADLHNVIRSKVVRTLFRLAGVKVVVIDKGRKGKHALTRKQNKHMVQLQTSAERYANVFRKAGFPLTLNFTSIYKKDDIVLDNAVRKLLDNSGKLRVGIAPFAKHEGKIYPLDKMEEVVKQLDAQGIQLFLFGGGKDEKAVLDAWATRYTHCTSVAGKLTFTTELQLISQLDVMLTMDSGNMHLASLVGVAAVSVWGATHPYAGFYGWRQDPNNAIQVDLFCRPCSVYGNKPCYRHDKPYECLTSISPQMIIEKINSLVQRHA